MRVHYCKSTELKNRQFGNGELLILWTVQALTSLCISDGRPRSRSVPGALGEDVSKKPKAALIAYVEDAETSNL